VTAKGFRNFIKNIKFYYKVKLVKIKNMETYKKKRRRLHLCKIAVLAICGVAFVRCHDYLPNDTQSSELRESKARSAYLSLNQAKQWYDEQMQGQEVFIKSAQGEGKQLFFTEPSWIYFVVSTKDSLSFVEVDLTDRIALDFVPADNAAEYEKTGELKYRHSVTRLIIQTEKKTGKRTGFLMTIIPSVEYSAHRSNQTAKNTYLKRDNNLDGLIVYHNLSGEFVNGWEYEKGQIVASLIEGTGENSISFAAIPATYVVKQKIATRSGDEYGEELPEIVITGEYNDWWISYYIYYYQNSYNNWTSQPDSGSDSSDGGYYSPSSPPPPVQDTPCDKLNKIVKDSDFATFMKNIRNRNIDPNKEYGGYLIKDNNTGIYKGGFLEATTHNNSASLGVPKDPSDAYIHTHPKGENSIFSVNDLWTIYDLEQKGKIKDKSTFIFAMISGDGTTYILKIEDGDAWTKWSNEVFKYQGKNKNGYELDDLFEKWVINYSVAKNDEIKFIKFLDIMKSGLKLYKGNVNNFNTWDRIGLDTNSKIINDNCK
jgi:hypothetical protein